VIHVVQKGGARRRGKRLTSVYHVPPVGALNHSKVTKAIASVPGHLKLGQRGSQWASGGTSG
jgi:hypothetical protein